MKKKLIFIMCLYLLLAAPMAVNAASTAIKSYGTLKVNSADGSQSIELYASDLQYLQSELDALFAELGVSGRSRVAPTRSNALQDNGSVQEDYTGRENIITE